MDSEIESYEVGGVVKTKKGVTMDGKDGGYFQGRPHSQGGIKAINVDTNTPIEVEGGEVVITKDAVSDTTKRMFEGKMMTNKEILSRINQSGGGVALAKGGTIRNSNLKTGGVIEYKNKYLSNRSFSTLTVQDKILGDILGNGKCYFTQFFSSISVQYTLGKNQKFRKGDYVIYREYNNVGAIGYGIITNARGKYIKFEDALTKEPLAKTADQLLKVDFLLDGSSRFKNGRYLYGNSKGNIPLELDIQSEVGYAIKKQKDPNIYYFSNSLEANDFINVNLDTLLHIQVFKFSNDNDIEFTFWGTDIIRKEFNDQNTLEDYLINKFDEIYYVHHYYLNSLIYDKNFSPHIPILPLGFSVYDIVNNEVKVSSDITQLESDVNQILKEYRIAGLSSSQTFAIKVTWTDDSFITIMVSQDNIGRILQELLLRLMLLSGWFDNKVDADNVPNYDLKRDFAFYGWGMDNTDKLNYIGTTSVPLINPNTYQTIPSSSSIDANLNVNNPQEIVTKLNPKAAYSILNEYGDSINKELNALTYILTNTPEYDFETRTSLGQEIYRLNNIINKFEDTELVGVDIIKELIDADSKPNLQRPNRSANNNSFQPNGDLTKLTTFQSQMVVRLDFVKWFGNFQDAYAYNKIYKNDPIPCSKVVTSGGEPLVVYMGVGREFEAVKFNKFPIAYFATSYEYAEWFAETKNPDGGWVLPFFLSIKNPLDLTIFGINKVAPKDFYDWLFIQTGMSSEEFGFIGAWQNPQMPPIEVWMYLRNNKAFLTILKESKIFDGIHFYENNPANNVNAINYSTEVWSTFYSNQCKLASVERGNKILSSVNTFKMSKGGKLL
jgi:hypothetical protein